MSKKKQTKTDDIILDFSWLKNLFSGKENTRKKKKSDDINLNLSDFSTILAKILPIILILIPLVVSINIRTLPAQIPLAEGWARDGIYNNIMVGVTNQVNQQYPNLPQQNKQIMINEQYQIILNQQKNEIEQAVLAQAEQIKTRLRDEQGNTYLGDIDSYFWLRYAKNILKNGHMGDELKEGNPYDNHMTAPVGFNIKPNFYPYFEAYLYRVLAFFNSDISLMYVAFLTPLYLSFFAIVAAFFIGKKISGNLAGFLAAMLIAVNPTVLSRSLGSDNDIVNAVFPLIIMLFTIYAFDSDKFKKTIIYSALAGLFIGIYSFAWSGWWFMFLFILGSAGIYLAYLFLFDLINEGNTIQKLIGNYKFKNMVLMMGVFLLFSYMSLSFFGAGDQLITSFYNPLKIVSIDEAARGTSIWPNVYTTVAELNPANIPQIVNSLGGKIYLLIALIASTLSLLNFDPNNKKNLYVNIGYLAGSVLYYLFFIELALSNKLGIFFLLALLSVPLIIGLLLSAYFGYKINPKHSILMIIWFMATMYAATKGVRFILLIIPAFVISFSSFFGIAVEWISQFTSKSLQMNRSLIRLILILISLTILIQPLRIGKVTATNYVPSVNDAWVESLTKIKQESAPDAIINSWWDFGHWFKYWADRSVTFDGASQNSQQAHWIGKALLTDDEDQAIAILRMLDCGANNAAIKLGEINGQDTYMTVNEVYEFLEMNENEVKKRLLSKASDEEVDEIIDSLFCEPPENYFITSSDMVGKSGVWAHFGSWNFERAKLYSYYKSEPYDGFIEKTTKELGYSEETAQKRFYELNSLVTDRQINDWISPWPSYGGGVSCAKVNEKLIQCNLPAQQGQVIPLLINLTTKESYVDSDQGRFYPNKFGYFDNDGEYKIKTYSENQIGYGIVLAQDNNVFFMSEELVGSLFTRLFYLNGQGIEHFKKFHDITGVGGTRIITWKVEWPD